MAAASVLARRGIFPGTQKCSGNRMIIWRRRDSGRTMPGEKREALKRSVAENED
jgi:hypothetical protein